MATVTKPRGKRKPASESGFRAEVPRCPECKTRVHEVARWATFGGSGLCEACEDAHGGDVGAAELSRNGSAASEPANDTRSLQPERKDDPHERRPYSDLLANLGRNRFNPRERFDEAELDELAESLQKHGQIQPVVIRHLPEGVSVPSLADPTKTVRTEIVAGERRALAAMRAGWRRINVMAITCDDARACELAIAENRDRRDISQVEYARGLKRLAELKGLDRAALAKDQNLSESGLSNLLRLLDAPPAWQQRVIDGVISGTHLRHAIPFLHVAAIEQDLLKHIAEHQGDGRFSESEKKWRAKIEEVVRQRGAALTRRVSVREPQWKSTEVRIDPKSPQAAELEIVELPCRWGGGKEKVALNRKLANQILTEKAKAWKDRHGGKQKDAGQKSEAKKLTPAEQKKRAQEAAAKRRDKLQNLVAGWLCWQCAQRVKDDPATAEFILLAIAMGASRLFDEGAYRRTTWGDFLDSEKRTKLLADQVSAEFYCEDTNSPEPWPNIRNWEDGAQELRFWCAELAVDPAAAWRAKDADGKQQFLGPLTEAWLDLHDRDQLAELAAEWKVPVLDKDSDADLRRKLAGNAARAMPMPAELAEIVRAQGTGHRGQKKNGRPK